MTDDELIHLVVLDPAAGRAAGRASRKLRRVIEHADEPVLFARVKLARATDPAAERPASAQATLDVNGDLVRAHVAGHTPEEAVDLLEDRLRDQLRHRAERRRARRHRATGPQTGGWRHGQAPTERPAFYARPTEDRQVLRHKSFALDEQTVDEAAFDMEMGGGDFHLFRELGTGGDALLQRTEGSYQLRRLTPSSARPIAETTDVELRTGAAATLSLDEALEWLNVTQDRLVFYRDRTSGRGHVVYRRYDGHYGLVTPADEPAPAAEPGAARRNLRAELRRLESVRDALVGEGLDRESEGQSVAELSSNDQHPADLGSETFERERVLSLLGEVDQEIADVRRALGHVDRGTYGRCEACGRAIADDRLQAMPATRFCLEHQAASENPTTIER